MKNRQFTPASLPALLVQDPNIVSQAMVLAEKAEALRQAEEAVEALYLRWAELEAKIS